MAARRSALIVLIDIFSLGIFSVVDDCGTFAAAADGGILGSLGVDISGLSDADRVGASSASSSETRCTNEDTATNEAEGPSLLQLHRRSAVGLERSQAAEVRRAVTFQGYGFRAFATHTGVLVALLRLLPHAPPGDGRGRLGALLSPFDIITSTSGGSWFVAELAYSKRFALFIESLAGLWSAQAIGRVFHSLWIGPLQQIASRHQANASGTGLNESEWQDVANEMLSMHLPKKHGANGSSSDFTASSVKCMPVMGPWELVVGAILFLTSGLSPSTSLGSAVNAWATGKLWLNTVSIVAPGGTGFEDRLVALKLGHQAELAYRFVREDASETPGKDFPLYVPGKIGVVLGRESGGAAGAGSAEVPVPICARSDCFGLRETFLLQKRDSLTEAPAPMLFELHDAVLGGGASGLSLLSVASATSAWLGPTLLEDAHTCPVSRVKLAASSWLSAVPPSGGGFGEANQLLDAIYATPGPDVEGTQLLASTGLHSLIDGAFTDSTGVLSAVAAGASKITAFVVHQDDLMGLFQGGRPSNSVEKGSRDSGAMLYFQIFNVGVEEVQAAIDNFACLEVPPTAATSLPDANGLSPYLIKFCFGRIHATTLENEFAGTVSGRPVELCPIIVHSSLNTGPNLGYNSVGVPTLQWWPYSFLVSELVTLTAPGNPASQRNEALLRKLMEECFA